MNPKTITLMICSAIAAIFALSIISGSFFTVDQGERGILLRNGAFVSVEQPGLHFKTPWIESVTTISTRTQTRSYDKVNSYSQDQQPADIKISATYHVDPSQVDTVYSRFGSLDSAASRVIDPHVNQELKVVFGRYTAASAIQDRAKLNSDTFSAIKASMAGDPEIVLESVQVENIDFSGQYVESIEKRMQAEIEVQKINQNLRQQEVNAKITVVNAQAAADAQLAQAKAQAEATRLQGEAEASNIRAQGEALKDNPDLVNLTTARRWDGKLPTTMVPGSAIPFLGVK